MDLVVRGDRWMVFIFIQSIIIFVLFWSHFKNDIVYSVV